MFKQAFRLAFITLIWKQYKASIVSTLILFTYLYLVGSIHADYLQHASLQNDGATTGTSFVIKWLALAAGVVIYGLFHFFNAKKTAPKSKRKKPQPTDNKAEPGDDPFHEIRERKKLRGPGDFLIKNDKK